MTAWMNLENIILSEKSQSQKDKYCPIPPYMRYLKKSNSENQRMKCWFPGAGGGRSGEVTNQPS